MIVQGEQVRELEKKHHLQLYKRYPITLVEGKGARVTDSDGKEYIDALAGIAVNSLGHCHPHVVKAIQQQAEQLIHISNLYYNIPQSNLAALLTEVSGMDRVFFSNSGAEAVEGAVKLARRYAWKKGKTGKIYSFENCFHGRTLATIAMGKKKYQEGFDPLPQGFGMLPANDLEAVKKVIEEENPVAFIIEPVQGEGGIRPVDPEFFSALDKLLKEHGITLILDEVQCGVARTGKMYAYQHFDVKPDIIASAKALGAGFPIGAVLATEEIASGFDFGIHGTTYGGNPLACAAAYAALRTIVDQDLPREAAEKGAYLIAQLRKKTEGMKEVLDIRGMGLMVGVELSIKGAGVVQKMMEKGVLANATMDTVIRLVPPIVISFDDLDTVIDILIESIKESS